MSKRQRTSTGRYDPNAWFPVVKHTLAAGDVGWEQGFRYTIEQADGDLFWFRSAEARDQFCKRHHLQIVDLATMASVRKEYAFDLTKPWQPANRLEQRRSFAITRRTLRATKTLPRRTVLTLVEPVSVPARWARLLSIRDLARVDAAKPAPMWDPLTMPSDHHAHVTDAQPFRLDDRVARSVVDDFLVEAHLRSDHHRYWLDFRVVQKRSPDDLSFDTAEALYNGGEPFYNVIPTQVSLEFTSTEHMHLTIRRTGK
jgi:hypothetical protein